MCGKQIIVWLWNGMMVREERKGMEVEPYHSTDWLHNNERPMTLSRRQSRRLLKFVPSFDESWILFYFFEQFFWKVNYF